MQNNTDTAYTQVELERICRPFRLSGTVTAITATRSRAEQNEILQILQKHQTYLTKGYQGLMASPSLLYKMSLSVDETPARKLEILKNDFEYLNKKYKLNINIKRDLQENLLSEMNGYQPKNTAEEELKNYLKDVLVYINLDKMESARTNLIIAEERLKEIPADSQLKDYFDRLCAIHPEVVPVKEEDFSPREHTMSDHRPLSMRFYWHLIDFYKQALMQLRSPIPKIKPFSETTPDEQKDPNAEIETTRHSIR